MSNDLILNDSFGTDLVYITDQSDGNNSVIDYNQIWETNVTCNNLAFDHVSQAIC